MTSDIGAARHFLSFQTPSRRVHEKPKSDQQIAETINENNMFWKRVDEILRAEEKSIKWLSGRTAITQQAILSARYRRQIPLSTLFVAKISAALGVAPDLLFCGKRTATETTEFQTLESIPIEQRINVLERNILFLNKKHKEMILSQIVSFLTQE